MPYHFPTSKSHRNDNLIPNLSQSSDAKFSKKTSLHPRGCLQCHQTDHLIHQQKKSTKLRPNQVTHWNQPGWMDTSSTSSSSSSSSCSSSTSDSEVEQVQDIPSVQVTKHRSNPPHRHLPTSQSSTLSNCNQHRMLHPPHQEGQGHTSKTWSTVLHAAGDELPFSPEEDQLTAKVNPQTDTLLLKVVKRQNKQKFLRGVPLPPNLRLHHLRVKVLPQGEVMVKAPFLLPGEMPLSMSFRMAQENSSLPMPSWIPVRVSWKQPSRDEEVPLHFGSEEMRLVGERSGGWKRGEEEDSLGQHLRKEKKKKMQSTGGGWQEQECEGEDLLQRDERDSENITERESCSLSHSSEEEKMSKLMENMLRPQHIREEVGGEEQVSIILQVNALGFSPEEIRVRVVKEKKLLIVEATKEQQQKKVEMVEGETAEKLLQEESGVAVKYLRREFVLCDWVDVSKVGVRVLPGGLVNIKLPLVKSKQQPKLKPQPQKVKKNKDSHRGDCGMDDVYTEGRQRQQSVGDWEKPMFS